MRKTYEPERDAKRFREAFIALGSRCRRWPTPADFLEALPRIELSAPKFKRLESEEVRKKTAVHVAEILKTMGMGNE